MVPEGAVEDCGEQGPTRCPAPRWADTMAMRRTPLKHGDANGGTGVRRHHVLLIRIPERPRVPRLPGFPQAHPRVDLGLSAHQLRRADSAMRRRVGMEGRRPTPRPATGSAGQHFGEFPGPSTSLS
ncbi:hypothetical protein GCM10023224_40380 [Streptomonospora halophila]|uniref:Uncharacterized protein n=1 Tax=Streptomonospora halophila TaxID=427369 RepID=A0ABP9GU71_9ACTN